MALTSDRCPAAAWRIVAPGVVVGLLFIVAGGCTSGTADPPSPGADLPPTASIQELMVSVVDPAAASLWTAVGTVVTEQGVEEVRPRTQEEWDAVRAAAVSLVESSHRLLASDEAVAREDPATWSRLVADFSRVSVLMLDAIDRRDLDRMFYQGGPLDLTCAACHRRYWDPGDEAAREIPSMQRDPVAAAPSAR